MQEIQTGNISRGVRQVNDYQKVLYTLLPDCSTNLMLLLCRMRIQLSNSGRGVDFTISSHDAVDNSSNRVGCLSGRPHGHRFRLVLLYRLEARAHLRDSVHKVYFLSAFLLICVLLNSRTKKSPKIGLNYLFDNQYTLHYRL